MERYRNEIRKYYGYREVITTDRQPFINHLVQTLLPKAPSNELLKEQIKLHFEKMKIESFSSKSLSRYIGSAKSKFNDDLIRSVYDSLDNNQLLLIDKMLMSESQDEIILLDDLKKNIPGAKLKNVNQAIAKINQLNKICIPTEIQRKINRKIFLQYHDRVMALSPSNILKFSIQSKYATMAIFCHIRLQILLDELTDTFIKITHRLRTSAENHINNEYLKERKFVEGKLDILYKLASVSTDQPKSIIEESIYPEVPKEVLLNVIEDLNQRGKRFESQVQTKICSNYAHGSRKILLHILKTLSLHEDHKDYKPILKAICFINDNADVEGPYYEKNIPDKNVISENWKDNVLRTVKDKQAVNKYGYELSVLEQVKVFLGFKAIWVDRSYRYRNPNDDIPADYDRNKKSYLEMLKWPRLAKTFANRLKKKHRRSLEDLNKSINSNKMVHIKDSKTNRNLSISPSKAQAEPININKLQLEIIKMWGTINLIDIFKEADLDINFTSIMETIAKSKQMNGDEFRKKLLLCLYALGTNAGLRKISIANGDVKYEDLRYIKKRFINPTNLRMAIKKVVNAVIEIRDPDIWGEATTTVACDSTQISAWDQNLLNEFHHRYKNSGVMIYWHVDNKSLCIYSQIKSCSSSEVGSMIKGVIEHDTIMNMNRVFTDTHGQSVIGFAVSYLLNFDLLPRFKSINKQKICGVNQGDKKKHPNIAKIMRGIINWKLIIENYHQIIKYITALRVGTIEPSVFVKRFSQNNYDHPVYKALLEIGKANKSIFLCKYIESEDLRIEINEGLNVVERMNNVMDFIFYGKLGELKTNKTEDQEISILCLHLLQVCMVYINTLIIQDILAKQYWKSRLTSEDYRALTPLFSGHINPYGLFPIDFAQRLSIGLVQR